jgi:folate-dependent phosphoribosylglycinamide formyltransferase PurN
MARVARAECGRGWRLSCNDAVHHSHLAVAGSAMLDTALPAVAPDLCLTPAGTAPIVVLTGGGPLPWAIIHAVEGRFGPVVVLEEDQEPLSLLFRRRLKKLGALEVAGQVAFGLWQRVLLRHSSERLQQTIAAHGLVIEPSTRSTRIPVGSVNSDICRRELRRLAPRVVLVVGTRMIGRATLAAIEAPFINYHAGINPKYRGMCGGYWAMASGDANNFGATVHLVDQGVDTGGILHWARADVRHGDNFVTYPFVLAAAARPLVVRSLEDALEGRLAPCERSMESRQRYHPTLWRYLWTGLTRGVW